MSRPLESDWKTYRDRVEEWRERYLRRKNREIVAILEDEEKTQTERFWSAKEKMKDEAKILEECLDPHSRSRMDMSILLMLRHGLMDPSDLEVFSKELQAWVRRAVPELVD